MGQRAKSNGMLFICCLIISGSVQAQFKQVPIAKKYRNTSSTITNKNARTSADEPLSLPFWDDFSTVTQTPDTSLWLAGENINIANGIGQLPPSINVAVFDGANALGLTYSQNAITVGKADTLVSKAIDLGAVNALFINDIQMSFFWQLEGQGEIPDEEDSIRLQFKDIDGMWNTVWSKTGGIENKVDSFVQEIIHVEPSLYAHDDFQFKFESFSRLAGAFDNWLIDYILLDKIRADGHIYHLDKSVTSTLSSLFGLYSALPASQFYSDNFDPGDFMTGASAGFHNLSSIQQAMQYNATVIDTISGNVIQILDNLTDDPRPPGPLDRRLYTTNLLVASNIPVADTVVLETTFSIKSSDTLLINEIIGNDTTYAANFHLASNDTVRSYFTINNYFAYDDGTAEFGAGVNVSGGQLAYQYEMFEEDTLTSVDIYFPNIGANFSGTSIDIMVWSSLDGSENSILSSTPTVVKTSIGADKMQRYDLDIPVIVNGIFYIGYIQSVDQRLTVGLDKNTDSGSSIFFNVSGSWQPNDDVVGSLMMRPVFETGAIVTGIDKNKQDELRRNLRIFPNPSSGEFLLEGTYDAVQIFNTLGQRIPFRLNKITNKKSAINLTGAHAGIYIVRLKTQNQLIDKKIIITD